MTEALANAALPVGAYFLGAVPFAFLIGSLVGVDLRRVGTGNVGAGNLSRVAGYQYGTVAAILDGLKGLAPVLVAHRLGLPEAVAASGGVAAVVGHNWSIFLGGRAGRGLATSVGVFLGLAPWLLLWTGFWAVAGWRVGGGPGGFVGWVFLAPVALWTGHSWVVVSAALLVALVVLIRRIQGNADSPPGWRAAFHRAVWDTDEPEVQTEQAAGGERVS